MLLNLVTKNDSIWIVSCGWSNHTILLLMFVTEKVLLLLVISLTVEGLSCGVPDQPDVNANGTVGRQCVILRRQLSIILKKRRPVVMTTKDRMLHLASHWDLFYNDISYNVPLLQRIISTPYNMMWLQYWCASVWYNSSPPSAACMRQWTRQASVQIMACRLFGAKPLPKPMLTFCQLIHRNKLQWNVNQNTKLFINENAYENVVWQNGGHFVQGEIR